jgi:hypothetical protein
MSTQVVREAALPSISWRKIGEDHGTSKGRVEKIMESVFSFGNYIDVDKMLVNDKNLLYDPRVTWANQTTRAMAFAFNDKFINGNPVSDIDELTGIHWRLQKDLASSQQIAAGSLDVSPDATGLAANIQTLFDKIDALLYALPDHQADMLIMNDTMYLRFWSAARQAGVLATNRDNLGREINTYKGARIIDAGYLADQSTRIITNVENLTTPATLTSGTGTSIYAVRTGVEYLTAIEQYALDVNDIGLLEDGLTYRTVVDWAVGMAISNPRAVARLYGIVAA